MKVTSLKLAYFRAIETAEFSFRPGFNLIVGANGAGKSTVLDAIRICASRVLPSISESRAKPISFARSDIRSGFPFLDVELSFAIGPEDFRFTRRQWREAFATDDVDNVEKLRREILDSDRLRNRARALLRELADSDRNVDSDTFAPPRSQLERAASAAEVAPNCVFFSTSRSVASNVGGAGARTVGGASAAYANALRPRRMYLAEFADWMLVQDALAGERRIAARHLEVLQSAVHEFLPDYQNLRGEKRQTSRLLIDREGIVLDVDQLSEGERGVLALVLELARRLSQANPSLEDPLREGHAVVLIDEIDLHLHPKWQRQIVRRLREAFPRCQFVATTHSPQVIGEVEHDRIQVIADGHVYSPSHSFGVDSSRVLEEIMGADSRSQEVRSLLSQISQAIGNQRYENAHGLLPCLVDRLGEDDPEVTRVRTLLDFMEGAE